MNDFNKDNFSIGLQAAISDVFLSEPDHEMLKTCSLQLVVENYDQRAGAAHSRALLKV